MGLCLEVDIAILRVGTQQRVATTLCLWRKNLPIVIIFQSMQMNLKGIINKEMSSITKKNIQQEPKMYV